MAMVTAAFSLGASATPAGAANAGDLDPAFGTGGTTIVDAGGSEDIRDMAVDAGGAIAVAGITSNGPNALVVAGLTANGELNPGFSGDGLAIPPFGANQDSGALLFQPDGKLLVATDTVIGPNSPNVGLTRLLSDGTADPAFNSGTVQVDDSGYSESNEDNLALTPDGKIVVGFDTSEGANPNDLGLEEYKTDGTAEQGFGIGAFSHADVGASETGYGLGVQSDGTIVRVGETRVGANPADVALTAVRPDGFFEASFAGAGREAIDLGGDDTAFDLAVLPDDGLLISAVSESGGSSDLKLIKLTADGAADPSFGAGGIQTLDFGIREQAPSIAIEPDGKIIVAFTGQDAPQPLSVARRNPDGSADGTFAGGGATSVDLGELDHSGVYVGLQPDGKIVAAADTRNGPGPYYNFLVARFLGVGDPAPTPPPTPTPTPTPTPPAKCLGHVATIVGTNGSDVLPGTDGDDVIVAFRGEDTVKAGKGDDILCLGAENDKASGGPGDDLLRGEPGNDKLKGGTGDDSLLGSGGRDTCFGGPGDDHAGCETEHGI